MKLSDHNRETLLIALNQLIEEAAEASAATIAGRRQPDLTYAPNGGLTQVEQRRWPRVLRTRNSKVP